MIMALHIGFLAVVAIVVKKTVKAHAHSSGAAEPEHIERRRRVRAWGHGAGGRVAADHRRRRTAKRHH
ncbi:hypothetical protein E2562_004429 [Oryza meyeriana var. granulata]|uniref:Uncharacterized protein n=1 Tax=Oryza meyeriana var. granulata TaxID=110450 RepID=A0A6G1CZ95_9ORYZ|nr:hypothetical protein E2562_004429 [Oryza meyeriana var. granulata]